MWQRDQSPTVSSLRLATAADATSDFRRHVHERKLSSASATDGQLELSRSTNTCESGDRPR